MWLGGIWALILGPGLSTGFKPTEAQSVPCTGPEAQKQEKLCVLCYHSGTGHFTLQYTTQPLKDSALLCVCVYAHECVGSCVCGTCVHSICVVYMCAICCVGLYAVFVGSTPCAYVCGMVRSVSVCMCVLYVCVVMWHVVWCIWLYVCVYVACVEVCIGICHDDDQTELKRSGSGGSQILGKSLIILRKDMTIFPFISPPLSLISLIFLRMAPTFPVCKN